MRTSVALQNGARIEYTEAGQGEPLVYLHGAGGALTKARFPLELGATFRVLLPSRPGYDGSTGTCQSAREEAEVMGAFIRQVCSAAVHLVAESAGGACGCWLAILYPELISSLELVAPTAFLSHRGPPPSPERMERVLFGDTPAWTEPLTADDRAQRQRNAQANTVRNRPADDNESLLARLGEVKATTLILWGTADELAPPDSGQVYKQHIPNSYRIYVYGAAHSLPVAACPKFVQLTTEFITRGDAFVVNDGLSR
jgi:pimeloyl-ACP methyl ester carboxylesterase